MRYAYLCVFGLKEPIESSYQLALCDPKTLLMVRNESTEKFILFHEADLTLSKPFKVTFEVETITVVFQIWVI